MCSYDGNVENITEINRRNGGSKGGQQSQINEEFLLRNNSGMGSQQDELFVLDDIDKRQQMKNAFKQHDESFRAKLLKAAATAPKLELTVRGFTTYIIAGH